MVCNIIDGHKPSVVTKSMQALENKLIEEVCCSKRVVYNLQIRLW